MEIIEKYFPGLSPLQKQQMSALGPLYEEWNSKINVISRKDIEQLYERHVLHSLAIHKFIQFKPGSRILDIGTGGGFPGIPLAIMNPDCHFTLVDSIGKKITVVNAVAEGAGIKNTEAFHSRAESIRGSFDFVVSRAVADLSELIAWSRNKYSRKQINALPNGLICLKGGDLREELKPFSKSAEVYELSSWFSEEFFETKKLVYLPMV